MGVHMDRLAEAARSMYRADGPPGEAEKARGNFFKASATIAASRDAGINQGIMLAGINGTNAGLPNLRAMGVTQIS